MADQGGFYIPHDEILRKVGRVVIRHGIQDAIATNKPLLEMGWTLPTEFSSRSCIVLDPESAAVTKPRRTDH